jgi:SPP1 gp7 family putative phage head morphogenesis protein
MKLFGFDISRGKAADDIITKPQYTLTASQGPLTPWFQDYYLRKVSGDFYEALREGIPVIDSAIRRLISLNGTIKIIGTNAALVHELEDFCCNVPVNDHQKGIQAFLENFSNEVFEQGFSMPEFLATPKFDDIASLRVPDSKQIIFRRNADGTTEPWYRYTSQFMPASVTRLSTPGTLVERIINATYNQAIYVNSAWEVKLNPANKLYFSINNENSDPYGVSLMRSMEFCSKLLMTMQNSLGNVWERFGDPSYHVKYKTTKKDLGGVGLEERRQKIQTDFGTAIRAKRAGKSADFVTAINAEAEMEISVIGSDGQILELEVPAQHVLDQIVSKTGLPSWMLGIRGNTVQGMATLEVEAALQDAKVRQLSMMPELIRLFSTFLRLRGRSWKSINLTGDPNKPGDWGIVFETPNLRDLVAQAQARFLNAQADMMGVPATAPAPANPSKHGKGCGCGNHSTIQLLSHSTKETRPIQWPELDQVEEEYEARLKTDWQEFAVKLFTIAKLDPTSIALGMAKEVGIEAFTFSEEQRAQIFKEMDTYVGNYQPNNPDSPLKMYYGESYSSGLIQAAQLIGKERPILDILKNKNIYEALVENGFKLVKDNATTAIKDKIIAEMEAHAIAGTNPLNVAERLKTVFGNQNSSWERLARTEMALSAETAKSNEWAAWGIKKVNFFPAPDACPICRALKGEYKLAECPVIPVHPRCRCSKTPAPDEVAKV